MTYQKESWRILLKSCDLCEIGRMKGLHKWSEKCLKVGEKQQKLPQIFDFYCHKLLYLINYYLILNHHQNGDQFSLSLNSRVTQQNSVPRTRKHGTQIEAGSVPIGLPRTTYG